MPILVFLLAAAAAITAGFLATAASPYALLALAGCVLVGVFAFLSPKLSLVLLLVSMLFSPEIGLGSVAGGRSVVLRYDDILIVIIFLAWLARTAVYKHKPFITQTPVQTPILVYTALTILSTSLGVMRGDIKFVTSSFYILKSVEYFLIYFMTVNVLESKEDIKKYLRYSYYLALAVTVYAYYYYYAAGPGARASMPFEAPLGKPEESEPASLGGYYIIVLGTLMSLAVHGSGSTVILALAAILFIFPAFLLTFSRASYIGFAFMTLALAFTAGKRRLMLIILVMTGFSALFAFKNLSEKVKERVAETYSGPAAIHTVEFAGISVKLEESAYVRYRSITEAFQKWLPQHPLLGRGVTGVGLGDTQYALLIGELGIAGFLVFFWMLYRIYSAARAVQAKYQEPWIKALALGARVSIVGLLFQAFGVNNFIIVRIMEPFWFLTAVIIKLYTLTGARPPQAEKTESAA